MHRATPGRHSGHHLEHYPARSVTARCFGTVLVMNGEVPKPPNRCSRMTLSNAPGEPPDVVASTGAGMRVDDARLSVVGRHSNPSDTELPRSHTGQSPVNGDLTRNAPVQSTKSRRVDTTPASTPSPVGPRSAPSAPLHKPQADTRSTPSPSNRAGLPLTSTKHPAIDREEVGESAKVRQHSLGQVNC